MVLRRSPHGTKAKTAHDMHREYRVLNARHPHFPYCPRSLTYSEDEAVMGRHFYAMERIKGIIIRRRVPLELNLGSTYLRWLAEGLIEVIAELHAVDAFAVGLKNLGKPTGYVYRQVDDWSLRYQNARTSDVPDGETVMVWLLDKMSPGSQSPAIIHNDFKLDNVVLDSNDPLRIIGVLDWEMTTLGDPLMGLACTLAYWMRADDSADMQPVTAMVINQPSCLTRVEVVELHEQRTGSWIKSTSTIASACSA
ncbi:hypothetical protein DFAR_3970004 [Desulfarculales bacterium]